MLFAGAWFVVLTWLALCVVAQVHFAWSWVTQPANPLRHESLIGLVMAALYAFPAVVAILVLRWRWWLESAALAKRVAAALVVAWVTLLLLVIVVS